MIKELRGKQPKILVAGAHSAIIQSVLDFDYVAGKEEPSIIGVVGGGKKMHKCFFGPNEILIPTYSNQAEASKDLSPDFLLNIASANSAKKTTDEFFKYFPYAIGAHLFAEGVREHDAVSLASTYQDKYIAGPSGVGLIVPGILKLGAVGGIYGGNVGVLAREQGVVAVVCSSGGMVNEIMDRVLRAGAGISFAVSYGGDRFPVTDPLTWCLEAEEDSQTREIVLFGELGGVDEYAVAKAIETKRITKPVYAYIAGHYDSGEELIQYGHAKALAQSPEENATSKMEALKKAGAVVFETYSDFEKGIGSVLRDKTNNQASREWHIPEVPRPTSLFTAVRDRGSVHDSFVRHAMCTLLEQNQISSELEIFAGQAFTLLVDHGAETAGSVNTIVTTRAGKDMSSSLAAGLLTIGSRFGGAINDAAKNWYQSVADDLAVEDMLEVYKKQAQYVPGIGHKKYTIHNNDPRVKTLLGLVTDFKLEGKYTAYACAVAVRTTEKKSSLILNVDGTIAAVLLDILVEKEKYTDRQIKELFAMEFFNSFFIIPRTVGFIGNHLSQRRRDEGLFRLPTDEVFYL